ncbi:RNA polymerase II-associated factor 1 [Mytilus galloprovincialis]|uniref:RNA polymerase II-associated factor 1 homolog n=1 Tax=Mytilus galloprovincialis TaxID=29158 RepID=A0A8B6C0K1_MYTGA|nr:RNA polymerase II-associated factor 1 [Mytilus galloprovincialis]
MPPTIQSGSREDRDRKRGGEKRSDLVARVKYNNTLPDIPFDPKFITYPFESNRFIEYKATSLERAYKYELLTEHDLGVTIDLINPDTYQIDPNAYPDPEDERLLEEDHSSHSDSKRLYTYMCIFDIGAMIKWSIVEEMICDSIPLLDEDLKHESCNSSISKIKSDLLDLKGCCQGPKKANINQNCQSAERHQKSTSPFKPQNQQTSKMRHQPIQSSQNNDQNKQSHSYQENKQSNSGHRNRQSHSGQGNQLSHTGQINRQTHSGQGNRQTNSGQGIQQSHSGQGNKLSQSRQGNTQGHSGQGIQLSQFSQGNTQGHSGQGIQPSQFSQGNTQGHSGQGIQPSQFSQGNKKSQSSQGNKQRKRRKSGNTKSPTQQQPFSKSEIKLQQIWQTILKASIELKEIAVSTDSPQRRVYDMCDTLVPVVKDLEYYYSKALMIPPGDIRSHIENIIELCDHLNSFHDSVEIEDTEGPIETFDLLDLFAADDKRSVLDNGHKQLKDFMQEIASCIEQLPD